MVENEMQKYRLFCQNGGCTAKLGPGALERVLSGLHRQQEPALLVGYESGDDAAVYRLGQELAVVQTLDFFPPMVEDPYLFGQIAAANALSDIYAMGADVRLALNIVCFPEELDLNVLGMILQGGNDKVAEAGGVLAGGHSLLDQGIKYGLSVTGTVHPQRIFPNNGCRAGDRLLLTKPLGTGIVCAAGRLGAAEEKAMELAVRSMSSLNKGASEILRRYEVHGCTDVTGFGLLGHLCEMLGGRFSARLEGRAVPCIPEAFAYAAAFYLTAAGQRNRNHVGHEVLFEQEDFALEELLYDAQTSGGLLASLPERDAAQAVAEISKLGLPCGIIGEVTQRREKAVYVQ